MKPKSIPISEGRKRVVIEAVEPEIDAGRYPIKRTIRDSVIVEADIFAEGHDQIVSLLRYRKKGARHWNEVPMTALGNDRWRGSFKVEEMGCYQYSLVGWVDDFLTWRHDLERRTEEDDIILALHIGADLVSRVVNQASRSDKKQLEQYARVLRMANINEVNHSRDAALSNALLDLMQRYPYREREVGYERELEVVVDETYARFSAWYELFPRSSSPVPGQHGTRHGTFRDCEARLDYVAAMGFDVLYLPPIHPIGRIKRKGVNNALIARPGDPGSPWAIGSHEGGHKSFHPELGSKEDFQSLVVRAKQLGIKIALDIAFQCAPDHPYVKEHPTWFRHRPDGSIQYAENPPKKYEDIYPFNFESEDWPALWMELKSIFEFWIKQGIIIFRVDNPHTKPFIFWEWVIPEIKKEHPEVIFLSEAFTRPKLMHRLAKLGFTQSYTYFTWRNTKAELTDYFTELHHAKSREYFRPNVWPNTPDILHAYLQFGGRPAFAVRLVLAATLASNYGIYGPAFELGDNTPREPGSEEYLHSEKYEIKYHDLNRPDSLKDLITRVNRIRHEHPALQRDGNLQFYPIDNDQLIAYGRVSEDRQDIIIVVTNLDVHYRQLGWIELPLEKLGIHSSQSYEVHDLLSDAHYVWQGARNYVELNPEIMPAHIFQVRL